MTTDRIGYLCDLLESDGPLPEPTRQWLLDALRQIDQGTDPRTALGLPEPNADSRNQVLRSHAVELPGSPWRKAKLIADQARRIHRGRKAEMPWILAADRLRPLPESQRQIFNILKPRT
jgi:hypothetical protein